ncbi:type I restriction endonuclease subunit R [Thermococcus barophilus]|uniref:type I site-specific deoxyribonuclease n=1 Tax=Thermococcus barophilus (strain DSM 11836 / MP) TaxID=391623 RepID=F0LIW2_THEBM|nr:HsdR family type I site-specific deoxyribonuclease [Thermococcus barophilus]ADT84564.1 Type I restriction-modification system restriction subunit R [Thermococcus barophilus MP]
MTEWEQCEKPTIERLTSLGWQYKRGTEILEDEKEPLLTSRLKRAIMKINEVSEKEAEEAITFLKTVPFGVEGSRRILEYLKDGVPVKDEETGEPKRLMLIDYKNPENNEFLVANQVGYPFKTKIPDMILYINGIPIVLIECKRLKKDWKEAYRQIKRYEKEMPELFKYVQFSIAIGDRVVYFPNVPWLEDVSVYEWKGESFDDLDNIMEILIPANLLDILKYFIFYREDKGVITKVLPRYMQFRATNKIVERAVKYAKGETERNKGLIWHWQGSGKTLTMIFSAYKIKRLLGNPTIFFIVDRRELEKQLSDELKSIGLSFEVVGSIPKLKEILMHSDGKRGIFVTLIHKFREDELKELREQLKKESRRRKTIMNRKDVIAFIDEGHRTQYGELAATMRSILKNASFFAFTGTPISKKYRDTYATFGYKDEPYLDRYFIIDSIRDGFTVKIAYQARLEDEVRLRKEDLEAFLASKLEEIPEEYREKVEEKLKKKLNAIKIFLKNPKRIEKIAEDIAKHYKESVEPFKAIVVAVDREACVLYKKALDKFLPSEYSEIVMTFNQNDPQIIQEYFNELTRKYRTKDQEEIREEIVTSFKKKEFPKILIVTDMLLTGFDAPILQTMYLDKPLKEHRLLQAIARTNRPFFKNGENIKAFGLIVDYVGIFKELKRALAIYDEVDIKGVAYKLDEIKEELRKKISEALALFDGIELKRDRDTIMKAVLILFQKQKGSEFQRLYREIRYYYKLLREDKTEFKNVFSWLTEVYYAYNSKVNGLDPEIEQKMDAFFKEALKFIHETIDIEKLRTDFPIIELDEEFLKKIMRSTSKEQAFYDLLFAVRHYINTHRGPLTSDLVEQVERIVERWRSKKEEIEKLYEELFTVAQKIQQRTKEREELGLTELEYALVMVLKKHVKTNTAQLISDVKELLNETESLRFPRWKEKADVVSELSRKVMLFIVRKYNRRYGDLFKTRDDILEVLKRWG